MSNILLEPPREIPVSDACEVLVAGGGVAGVAAAIAAARSGADVLLLEREYALGGLATLGLITIYLPLCDGMGNQVIFGLGEELLHLSIQYGAEKRPPSAWLESGTVEERKKNRFMTQYNPHLFALAVERLLLRLGVRILYGTVVVDADVSGDAIQSVVIENKSGRSAIRARSFVDATGDADLCKLAGAPTAIYRAKNGLASWYYYISGGKPQLKMFGLADVVPGESGQGGSTGNETVDVLSDVRYSGVDGPELSQMVIDGHQRMFDDILKNREADPERVPVTISTIPLVRMSRRLAGAYELDDNEDGCTFPDSIGMTGDWRKRGPVYEIPYRCLYSPERKNLFAAGRDISVTDAMWDITRVIPAAVVTGQAAGTAAAMGGDCAALDVQELQRRLVSQHVKLHRT